MQYQQCELAAIDACQVTLPAAKPSPTPQPLPLAPFLLRKMTSRCYSWQHTHRWIIECWRYPGCGSPAGGLRDVGVSPLSSTNRADWCRAHIHTDPGRCRALPSRGDYLIGEDHRPASVNHQTNLTQLPLSGLVCIPHCCKGISDKLTLHTKAFIERLVPTLVYMYITSGWQGESIWTRSWYVLGSKVVNEAS